MRKAAKMIGSFLIFTPFSLILACVYALGSGLDSVMPDLPAEIQVLPMAEIGDGESIGVGRELSLGNVSYGIDYDQEDRPWEMARIKEAYLIATPLDCDD